MEYGDETEKPAAQLVALVRHVAGVSDGNDTRARTASPGRVGKCDVTGIRATSGTAALVDADQGQQLRRWWVFGAEARSLSCSGTHWAPQCEDLRKAELPEE